MRVEQSQFEQFTPTRPVYGILKTFCFSRKKFVLTDKIRPEKQNWPKIGLRIMDKHD
jgi:hypothetical protein